MPVPIMRLPDKVKDDKTSIDYSFLLNSPVPEKKKVIASNKDASLLFELWQNGERVDDKIKLKSSKNISSNDILRLKTLGFLVGDLNDISFTRKGKLVITTMALGETNRFEKNKQPKSYTEILASMDKRHKKGYRIAYKEPKYAVNTSNNLNLKNI